MDEPINNLSDLKLTLDKLFSSDSKSLSSEAFRKVLSNYIGDDWKTFVNINHDKYSREIVLRNENYEIIIITWDKKQASHVHNHPSNGCLMKILHGTLLEEQYCTQTCCKTNELVYDKNNISYIDNLTCYHRIVNNTENHAVSLHIYSPPNYIPAIFEKIEK
jgi:cysteine dioxygenase